MRSAHLHPYFTKSDVRVVAQNVSQTPVSWGQKPLHLYAFTSDSGNTAKNQHSFGWLRTYLALGVHDGP